MNALASCHHRACPPIPYHIASPLFAYYCPIPAFLFLLLPPVPSISFFSHFYSLLFLKSSPTSSSSSLFFWGWVFLFFFFSFFSPPPPPHCWSIINQSLPSLPLSDSCLSFFIHFLVVFQDHFVTVNRICTHALTATTSMRPPLSSFSYFSCDTLLAFSCIPSFL